MRKVIPWGVRGGGMDVREAARGAARQDGMNLGEWLAQVVGQYAADTGIDPANLDEDECAEAIAAQLNRLGIGRERKSQAPRQQLAAPRAETLPRESWPRRKPKRAERAAGSPSPVEKALLEKALARLDRDPDVEASEQSPRVEPKLMRPKADATSRAASLAAAIAEITRRQRALEEQAETLSAARLDRRTETEATAISASLANLRSDIAALAGQVQSLRRDQAERDALPPAGCNLDKLRTEIAAMSDALRDLASRGSLAPLEASIRNLTHQIEDSRSDGIRETVLQPLERLVNDLRLALAEIDPRTTIRGLEGEVRKLGSKLAPVEKIERQVQALTDRLDSFSNPLAHPDAPERREEAAFQAIADELRLLTGDSGTATLAKIEAQLAALAAKVEEALAEARDESRYAALADRINDVHHELAERMAQGMPQVDVHALEDLVRDLAEKIDAAHRPQADRDAIEALQRQVSAFAARLDRVDTGFPSLTSLEQSIGDLFAELERTRDASFAAAERAARNALDQALASGRIATAPSNLAQEFVDLRNMQDEAGRRTLATLNAVHETLEKVVDRLATVESEIADVRSQKPAELLASGPAPNFAPPPQGLRATPHAAKPRPGRAGERAAAAAARDEMVDDFLIEPGRGFPRQRDGADADEEKQGRADPLDMPEAASDRAGFIAAARRAARAAQMESAAAIALMPNGRGSDSDVPANLIEQTRNFISHHKRPVVLSIAALFLAVGAYAVVKTVTHSSFLDLSAVSGKEAPARSLPGRATASPGHGAPAPQPSLAAPKPAAANPLPTHAAAALPSLAASDPITTGAIGAKPAALDPAPRVTPPDVLQSLAQAGNAKAQYTLATAYATGRDLPRDFALAAQWYEKAAAQTLAPAQYRLGSLYEKGLGVHRDIARAMDWYRKAAEHGNVRAMHNLAVLTAEGGETGKPDYATAAQWFRKAAEYGVRDSQYNVAILLARGLGVPQNLTLSYMWFAVAAAQGDEDAGKKRDDVGARLSAADLAAAKAIAAAFHPKTPDPAANEVTPPPGGWRPLATSTNRAQPKLSRL